ncbi:hypothetical protein IF2G_04037 [Cordyceps javanica]|nr:hypothetical protein IF2G_04037 [Cordyceps javanica]
MYFVQKESQYIGTIQRVGREKAVHRPTVATRKASSLPNSPKNAIESYSLAASVVHHSLYCLLELPPVACQCRAASTPPMSG